MVHIELTGIDVQIACHQLVDQGRISLHDPEAVAKICPELAELQILTGYEEDGTEIYVKPKERITLNMLLNHTSGKNINLLSVLLTIGLAYPFSNPLIARWTQEHKVPSMVGPHAPLSSYIHPLTFEPGTRFQYAIGIDWAGFIVSRISGLSLEEYFQKHIFEPCGMTHTSFHPPKDYDQRKMAMCFRNPQGTITTEKGTWGHVIERTFNPAEIGPLYSGGGGLFGTARDYLRLLSGILASGKGDDPKALISKESFDTLFTNTLNPDHLEAIQADVVQMAKGQNAYDSAAYEGNGKYLGYSPGLLINFRESKFGRSAYSGCWDGAARTMYWLDPKKGIAVSHSR